APPPLRRTCACAAIRGGPRRSRRGGTSRPWHETVAPADRRCQPLPSPAAVGASWAVSSGDCGQRLRQRGRARSAIPRVECGRARYSSGRVGPHRYRAAVATRPASLRLHELEREAVGLADRGVLFTILIAER